MTMASLHHPSADVDPQRYIVRSYSMTARVFHWLTVALVMFMVSSAVLAKQLGYGPWSDTLFMLHKTTGIITLCVVLLRVLYRVIQSLRTAQPASRRWGLHWLLYAVVILLPLLGWAGLSDFGARELFSGFTLPAIWPQGAGYDVLLFSFHAYLAFGLLALVALHIGLAMQDYMVRSDDEQD
jgi:cytochrome b561